MRHIVGAQSITQQAYTLSQALQEQQVALLYWLLPGPELLRPVASALRAFAGEKQNVFALDLSDEVAPAILSHLLHTQEGLYTVSLPDFSRVAVALSFVAAKQITLRAGFGAGPTQIKQSLVGLGYGQSGEAFAVSGKGGSLRIDTPLHSYRVIFGELGIERIMDESNGHDVRTAVLPPATIDLQEIPEKELPLPVGKLVYDDVLARAVSRALTSQQLAWTDVIFSPLRQTSQQVAKEYRFQPMRKFDKDFATLAAQIMSWRGEGYTVKLFAVDVDVVLTALGREGIKPEDCQVLPQLGPMQGFLLEEDHIVVLTHTEVFGRKRGSKKNVRRSDTAFVSSLQANDYVVHQDHGVARYLGLVTSTIEGHQRENLLLEYAKGDRLYVPVELAYKVDRYVGEAKPALQRLSGTSWIRLTRKAAQDSQAFAKDLLSLYAKRSLVKIEPWHVFEEADAKMHQSFGYTETRDQEQAIREVYADLTSSQPMDRLVVGDVGFGKTEVAIRAAYQAFLNQKQTVVLCPTTLLAQQHFDTFRERFAGLGVNVEMLSRFTGKIGGRDINAKQVVAATEAGRVHILIGTHRLLSQDVRFQDLGLIIIDEEQRFGVRHKEKLKQLRHYSHILTLSATPIPRTLYFSLAGLRDISTIQTPPRGRQPIETVIEPYSETHVKEAIAQELERGGQVFYLYNHVQTIHATKRRLQELVGKSVRIGIVHGQMPEDEMAAAAEAFDHGRLDVLVCTTIIENGLDLPNVNTLVVEDATKFGLGQLYQIRGRIGRGQAKAYAHFLYPAEGLSGLAAKRLRILQEAKELGSGFELATRDLEMRGMGQLLGKRQHGHIQHVGLSLYGRLLRQAVEELESGEVPISLPTASISLPVDYGIPETLVPDAGARTRLYRQLALAEDAAQVKEILEPWLKKSKALPPADRQRLLALEEMLALRPLAQQARATAIDYQETRGKYGEVKASYSIELSEVRPEHVERLIPVAADFRVIGNRLVIPAESVAKPLPFVKRLLQALAST